MELEYCVNLLQRFDLLLSYKHAFHVGNHADVVKHLCLIATLEHYKKKNKPFCLFDTHAGAGMYPISDPEVQKNKEFKTGIEHFKSYQAENTILQQYLNCLADYEQKHLLPGSPAVGLGCLRNLDALVLMELHPSESEKLKSNIQDHRVSVHARNGFEGLIALTPPQEKRGVVLIDPPYEQMSEYSSVVKSVEKVLSRWHNACVLIWYPLLGKRAGQKSGRSESMLAELKSLSTESILNVQLIADSSQENTGMYGSGIAVINPPWQLDQTVNDTLLEVSKILNPYKAGYEWL